MSCSMLSDDSKTEFKEDKYDEGFALNANKTCQSKHQPDFLLHCLKANMLNPLSSYNRSCFMEENRVT